MLNKMAMSMPKPRPPFSSTVATIERGTVIAASSTSSLMWHDLLAVSIWSRGRGFQRTIPIVAQERIRGRDDTDRPRQSIAAPTTPIIRRCEDSAGGGLGPEHDERDEQGEEAADV